ncbi:protein of unknown function [Paraburkholderia kururiensis]
MPVSRRCAGRTYLIQVIEPALSECVALDPIQRPSVRRGANSCPILLPGSYVLFSRCNCGRKTSSGIRTKRFAFGMASTVCLKLVAYLCQISQCRDGMLSQYIKPISREFARFNFYLRKPVKHPGCTLP